MERLVTCLICIFLFVPTSAFAGGGEKDKEKILLKNCETYELEADEKICQKKQKRAAAQRLKDLEGKVELQKKRIDRLEKKKKQLSYEISKLKQEMKKKNEGPEKQTAKQTLKLAKEVERKLSVRIEKLREKHKKRKAEVQKALRKLKQADEKQREAMSKVVDTIDKVDSKVGDLSAKVDNMYDTVTEAKAKAEEVESRLDEIEKRVTHLEDEVGVKEEQGQVRVSTGAEMFLFWGGPGFTGFFSKTKLRKPFADSRFSLKGEISLGAGFTRGALRPALKAELGPSFRLSEQVRASLDVGYSQAHYFREDVAEFRYLYFAPGLNFQVTEHVNIFSGGNLGTVFHRKGKKPDFGGGLQLGVSFEF